MAHNPQVQPVKDYQLAVGTDGALELAGVLDKNSVNQIHQECLARFHDAATTPETINLAGVTTMDSAGVALLIEWIRLGRRQHCTIRFLHIPDRVLPLAKLFGVEHLLR